MNCHRNYPWYRDWQQALAGQDVFIIGIHTPETAAERNVETLAARMAEAELDLPVLVDNDRKNWDVWGNLVWPSVYVVDRDGYLRAWWFGELNWRGAGGQNILRQRVTELLSEPRE